MQVEAKSRSLSFPLTRYLNCLKVKWPPDEKKTEDTIDLDLMDSVENFIQPIDV